MIALFVVVGLLVWIGSTLVIDAWLQHRRRLDLAERLRPFQPMAIGDEAERWLDSHR